MDALVEKYPELGEIPRPDKAFVYLISKNNLVDLKIKKGEENENLDRILFYINEEYENRIKRQEKEDNDGNFEIRKGDMVYIETLLGPGNRGKYIYYSKELVPLNIEVISLISEVIPEIIQVIIDVPIRYYEGRVVNSTYVPFNFERNIGYVDETKILRQQRFPYFKFQRNGETYVIGADYKSKTRDILNCEFIAALNKARYFSYIPIQDTNSYLKLGDWRNIMYLPLKI